MKLLPALLLSSILIGCSTPMVQTVDGPEVTEDAFTQLQIKEIITDAPPPVVTIIPGCTWDMASLDPAVQGFMAGIASQNGGTINNPCVVVSVSSAAAQVAAVNAIANVEIAEARESAAKWGSFWSFGRGALSWGFGYLGVKAIVDGYEALGDGQGDTYGDIAVNTSTSQSVNGGTGSGEGAVGGTAGPADGLRNNQVNIGRPETQIAGQDAIAGGTVGTKTDGSSGSSVLLDSENKAPVGDDLQGLTNTFQDNDGVTNNPSGSSGPNESNASASAGLLPGL